ncbi:ion transporter [Limnohabitans sp. G3-2]|uniref:ion transporter n=1 Tax=Limnohabitans sp. G3-2 TaxID=1100711 RepID=UPI000C1E6560|nr:ion transporter [Limnohabitans sp. G3-2]PIT74033.1 potassium channel protein [Limnohabitans sp. G3-2]
MNVHHPLRHRLFLILEFQSHKDKKTAWVFSWVLTLMVLSSVLAVILESVPAIEALYGKSLAIFDAISMVFFSVEYLLRIWTAADRRTSALHSDHGRRLRYVLSFHGLIDLLAILPFFLQALLPGLDLRFLRVIRIMRILKLSHYSTALEDLLASIYAERDAFISALYLLALSILITSCLMYFAEHALQPDKLGTIPDAMWWSIVTITTVGYGDVTPVSSWGKVIGAFTALSGVFTVALLTGIVASAFATRVRTHELEFTTEVEELLKDGQVDPKERRTIEHLRREFSITEEHARAIIRQILEEKTLLRPKDGQP